MTPSQKAGRRYRLRQTIAMITYGVMLGLVIQVMRRTHPTPPLRYLLALIPALPILAIVWAIGCYLVEETDEVRRTKAVLQLLWGSAVALSVSTLWGFLEVFGGMPHLPAYLVFPVFCFGMLLSLPFIIWKYR